MGFLMVLLFQEAPTEIKVGEVKQSVANIVCRYRHTFILLIQVIFIKHEFFSVPDIVQSTGNTSRNKTLVSLHFSVEKQRLQSIYTYLCTHICTHIHTHTYISSADGC